MAEGPGKTTRVLLGRIGAAQGLRGAVRIQSYCADPLDIASYGPLHTKSGKTLTLTSARLAKNMVIAEIEGVGDRTAAEAMNGVELFVPRDRLPVADDDDDFYYADLIGLLVRSVEGQVLGTVAHVDDYGAGAVIEIGFEDGKSALFAFTRAIVPEVNLAGGYLVLVPPEETEAREGS